jgi:hypothetical protein
MHNAHSHGNAHSHETGAHLDQRARAILERGLRALLDLSEGLTFQPFPSARYPLPLAMAVYGEVPDPQRVLADVARHTSDDPVRALESALVLLELVAGSRPAMVAAVIDDRTFLSQAFATKRQNGWIALLGSADLGPLQEAVNARWRFRFASGPDRWAGIHALLNMVVRHAFVYGKIAPGDSHALGHFVEEFSPALLVCRGEMDDLDLTLSLAAMKLGVPAVVPTDYPFVLGRQIRADALDKVVDALVAFPNIHRLLDLPGVPPWPEYASVEHAREKFAPAATWGDTPDSFYLLRKGPVPETEVTVTGQPGGPMGVLLTAEAEPLDALDRAYIEQSAIEGVSMVPGALARLAEGHLIVDLAADAALTPERLGEMLIVALRREFAKIERLRVEIIFDPVRLAEIAPGVRREQAARRQEIAAATEESVAEFMTCVGCSPFAPDHVCVLTPQRPPQCGRAYAMIKAGALYSYDDMSNIHHRALHAGINSFGVCAKGRAIDPLAGEWSGVNEAVSRLSGGRTTRVQLHSLRQVPHTGCGCFRLIMFETGVPRPGVGIMARGYKGHAPDGRTWQDLHYALAGKQTPGLAGGAPGYLFSERFLAAHGGWASVVWVSPAVATWMGDALPGGVAVGTAEDEGDW